MKNSSLKSLFSLLFLVGTVSIALYCILTKDTIDMRFDMPGGVNKPISPFFLLPPTLFSVGAYFVTRFLAGKPMRMKSLLRRYVIPMNEHNAPLIRNFHESVSLGVTNIMFYCSLFISGIIAFKPFITWAVMMLPFLMIGWSSFKLMRDKEMQ
jgi:hypothetical protein